MLSDNDLFLRGCMFAFGAILAGIGFWQRRTANRMRSFPLTPVPAIQPGAPASVSGSIEHVGSMHSPVHAKDCVFYRVKSEKGYKEEYTVRTKSGIDERRTREVWRTVDDAGVGGFFINDGSGPALVVPTLACLDLEDSGSTSTDRSFFGSDMSRKTEWLLCPGQTVYCMGVPRAAEDFLAAAAALPGVQAPVIARVRELSSAGTKVPCFYLDAIDTLEDQSYQAALEFDERSAKILFTIGGLISGGVLLYRAFEKFGFL